MRAVLVCPGTPQEKRALFHCWGSASMEANDGNMVDTVAIVELEDGSVSSYMPHHVKFLTPPAVIAESAGIDRISDLEKKAEALIDVTLISHFGGLANVSEGNALIAIRSVTLPFFNDMSHCTIQEQERLVNRAMIRTLKN